MGAALALVKGIHTMTHDEAISTGQNAATTFNLAYVVYRLPAWPVDVFGCIRIDRELPSEALTFEHLEPAGAEPTEKQGSLF